MLDQIGVKAENWDVGDDNMPILSSGADLSAIQWAKFGQFVLQDGQWNSKQLVDQKALQESVEGSSANSAYGLTWWLRQKVNYPDIEKLTY